MNSFYKRRARKIRRSKSFWVRHNLRKPDHKDFIFGIISVVIISFCIGMDVQALAHEEIVERAVTKELVAQAVYCDNIINEKEAIIQEKEDLYEQAFGIEDVDLHNMKKSEIKGRIENLKIFMDSFESFNMTESPLYEELDNQLQECYTVLEEGSYLYPYTEEDYNILAYAIQREAGSSYTLDEHRDMVGMVIINRRNQGGINKDLTNPTIADIINQVGQYPYKSWDFNADVIQPYCYESAIRCLEGEIDCPSNVIWQATFKQGDGVYKSYNYSESGSTTYICYSN